MTGRKELFDEAMRLGNSAAWNLEWDEAIEHYRKALAEFPESSEALSCLGLGLLEMGNPKKALDAYRLAVSADPEDPVPLEKCAEIHEQLGQFEEAIERRDAAAMLHMNRKDVGKALANWTHVARLVPANLDARMRLAKTYERMGRHNEAISEYLAVASILQQSGNSERAIETTQHVLNVAPGDSDAIRAYRMLREGEALPKPADPPALAGPVVPKEAKALEEAEEEQTKELEGPADPEEEAMRQAVGALAGMVLEASSGKGGSSRRGGKGSKKRAGRGKGMLSRGLSAKVARHLSSAIELQSQGHKRGAIKEIQLAIESGADAPAVRYTIGALYKDIGDYDSAQEHLAACLKDEELALGANLALGRLARIRNDFQQAADYLLEALRLADALSVDSEQYEQLNKVYAAIKKSEAKGEPKRVAGIVESALKFLSGPEWMQRIRSTRKQLESQAQGEEVVPIAEMLVVGGSNQAMQALARIDQLVEQGQFSAAMEEAMLALSQSPGFLPLHTRMAEMMIRDGHVQEGVNKLITIGETHAARGEHERSVEVMTKILQHSPVNVEVRKRLIAHLLGVGRQDEALEHYLEMAEIHRQMAQINEARQVLAEAQELAQSTGASKERMKQILHQMGDIDLARLDLRQGVQVYEEIRKLDPEDDVAGEHLIDLYLRLGQENQAGKALDSYLKILVKHGEGAKALKKLEQLVRDYPGKQVLHARLGEAYRAAGRKADAISQFDALGEILLDAGKTKEAAKTIKTILELGPPDVEGYRELLRNIEAGG
jgi:tetratricopeptide (TPR) repeat protein